MADEAKQGGKLSGVELNRWLKFDSWSLREAALLSCGQIPELKKRAPTIRRTRKKFAVKPGAVARKFAPTELDEIKDLIRRARNVETFGDPVKPAVFIDWLRAKHPNAKLFRILEDDARRDGTTRTALPSQPLNPNQKAAEANKLGTSHKILLALAIKFASYNDKENVRSIEKIMSAISDCGMKVGRDTLRKHLRDAYDKNVDEFKQSVSYPGEK